MAKQQRRRIRIQVAEIPMSSMIDIVFLLLIYFIVTQKPIIEDTFLNVDLPSPGSTQSEKPITLFTIDVMRTKYYKSDPKKDLNTYYVNGRRWNFPDLRDQLIRTGETDKDQTIIINCGPNAIHQKLIQLLDACAEAELTKLNIVNDEAVMFTPGK